jgi:hypothetical protein
MIEYTTHDIFLEQFRMKNMDGKSTLCQGITNEGTPCKLRPQKGSKYCHHHHHPDQNIEKEQRTIQNFFQKHKDGIAAFLAGTIADSVTGDIYDYIKEQLKLKHLVPPTPEEGTPSENTKKIVSIGDTARHFRANRDLTSLYNLLSLFEIGMSREHSIQILGSPDKSEGRIRVGTSADNQVPVGVSIDFYQCKGDHLATFTLKFAGTKTFDEKLEGLVFTIKSKDAPVQGMEIPLQPIQP